VALSGIGKFTAIDLSKKLAVKAVRVNAAVGETSEGLAGQASPKDLETLFQLIYLQFTAPRLDTSAYQAFKNQAAPYLANRGVDPDEVFSDTVQVTMAQHNYRARPLTTSTFAEINPEKALDFYRTRFADASDFVFAFVGNVDTLALKPLVEKYLASLPALNRKETFRDNGVRPPTGVVERVVRKGVEPKANTIIEFTGSCQYAPEIRFAIRAMMELVPDPAERNAARAAWWRVQPERGRLVHADAAAGILDERAVQLVAGQRREADEERVRDDRFAEDEWPDASRREQGQGAADPGARGRSQAERLLGGEHRRSRSGG
jgi:zinc protease